MATTSKTLNPYTAARQEWDERYGDLISRAKHWRLIAFLSMATTLVCVTGMVTIGYRSHTVPYVVALDEVGRAVPVIPAKQVAVKDVRLQEATVARWITNLRTVVIDPVVQRKMVDEVYALASASSAASQTSDGLVPAKLTVRETSEGNGGRIDRVDRPAIFEEL